MCRLAKGPSMTQSHRSHSHRDFFMVSREWHLTGASWVEDHGNVVRFRAGVLKRMELRWKSRPNHPQFTRDAQNKERGWDVPACGCFFLSDWVSYTSKSFSFVGRDHIFGEPESTGGGRLGTGEGVVRFLLSALGDLRGRLKEDH